MKRTTAAGRSWKAYDHEVAVVEVGTIFRSSLNNAFCPAAVSCAEHDSHERGKRIPLYGSVVTVAQDLDGDHSIHDPLHTDPQRLRTQFTVALTPEESAK